MQYRLRLLLIFVVAIVIGLALQSSLGEIVSGLFMSVESPYHAGDWITLDAHGGVWAQSPGGAVHYDPRTGTWTEFTNPPVEGQNRATYGIAADADAEQQEEAGHRDERQQLKQRVVDRGVGDGRDDVDQERRRHRRVVAADHGPRVRPSCCRFVPRRHDGGIARRAYVRLSIPAR